MEQWSNDRAAERRLHGYELSGAELAEGFSRASHQNEPGLEIAFQPTAALRQPDAEGVWRIFMCNRSKAPDDQTCSRDTHTKIGVFRDIPGVPTAKASQGLRSKVIACSAQEDGQSTECRAGQEQAKLNIIFQGPLCREPVRLGIVCGEPGLQTDRIWP